MDVELLASTLQILAQAAAPQLREWGNQATEAALKGFVGEKAKQAAEALRRLKPKIEAKPMAEGSVKALGEGDLDAEEMADAEETLHKQLVKILNADPELTATLLKMVGGVEVRAEGRGISAGRDVKAELIVTGDNVTIVQGGATTEAVQPSPEEPSGDARTSYLSWVMERAGFVPLTGVDPAVGRAQDRRLHLGAVYTALRTRTPRRVQVEAGSDDAAMRHALRQQNEPPLSALEQLDRHSRLVLLGDPGSGKSTFVDFV